MNIKKKTKRISALSVSVRMILAAIVAVAAIFLAIGIGSVSLPSQEILRVLGEKISGAPEQAPQNTAILLNVRLPRVLLAFLVGTVLSVSGTAVQSVLQNPLASPFTLGVSSGASLGACLVMASGFTLPLLGNFTLPLSGLTFGVATVILAVWLAQRVGRNLYSASIVLTGMTFSLFLNGALTLLAGLSGDQYERIMRWMTGSFSGRGWNYVRILAVLGLLGFLVLLFYSRELDVMTFGEEYAAAAGVETGRMKWILLCASAVLTGAAVSFAGVIGFVDLIAPHAARRLSGGTSRHRIVLPLSGLIGGTLMVLADLAARVVVAPQELPVGAVTALLGAPFFAWLYLFRGGKKQEAAG